MKSFADTLAAINAMKTEGVIEEYAVAGAMALLFWTEPVPTLDLDVLVFLPPSAGPLVNLEPIYSWAAGRGYSTAAEHILIEDVPTQFVPSPNSLSDEAISSAATVDYSGVPVRVVRPEYLIALYLKPAAKTPKRRECAAAPGLPTLNREQLDDILRSDMDSRSSRPEAGAARARPSRALLARLRAGKAALREHRIALPLPDKVRQLLQLQHIQVVMLAKRRPHRPWERPWDVEP